MTAVELSEADLDAYRMLMSADDVLGLLDGLRPYWHEEALCRGQGTEAFFPTRGVDVRPVKALCEDCPVRDQCLAEGLDDDLPGIWGGTSERQRRRLRSEPPVAEAPTIEAQRRWPLEPLLAELGHPGVSELARRVEVHRKQVYRWRECGLSDAAADDAAIALGLHPAMIWDGWDQLGPP